MFGLRRLRRWWQTRKRVKARALLQYWDGERVRYGDPLQIWLAAMHDKRADLKTIAPMVDRLQEPETSQFVAIVADAFGVTRWDSRTNTGLTDAEIVNLMVLLGDYVEVVKKNSSLGPTSPTATELPSSIGPEAPADPTRPSSDSTSS